MTDKNDKLNELRTNALEMELRKPKRDNGMEAELEYHADALAHDDRPGTSVTKHSGKFFVIIAFVIVACVIGGMLLYFVSSDSEEDTGICRTQCNDGTCSSSTGPGTCSYHGGIKKD
ncbi:MAG: hypothetical protein IJU23_13935 [Proteobacteria bacterium]|nr:hypothetical protein [Pseudomonadota bacterium]